MRSRRHWWRLMQVPPTQTIVNRPTLMADLLLMRRSLMHFDNRVPTPRGYPAIGNPGSVALAGYDRLKARLQQAISGAEGTTSKREARFRVMLHYAPVLIWISDATK